MIRSSITRSLRRLSAWLMGSLTAPMLAYFVAAPPPQRQSEPNARSRLSAECVPQDICAIEFAWPEDLNADSWRLVIGSLEKAGTRTAITILPVAKVTWPEQISAESPSVPRYPDRDEASVQLAARHVPRPAAIEFQSKGKAASRVFFLQSAPDHYQPITARTVAESERVRIWDEVSDGVSASTAQLSWLIERYENDILPRLVELYGEISDVDGDGKLAICLTDRLAQMQTNDSPVEGVVQANDFHADLPRPHSNQADVMFLSRSLQPGPQAMAVLAHEAAHLAVFSRKFETDPHGFRPEDDWLNEGLAHFAEVLCSGSWTNLQTRIAAFRQHPETSPLVVVDAHREGFWRDPGSRGAAWSFLSWLAHEHGPEAVSELAGHPLAGCAKLEAVLNQPFADIFRRWTVHEATRDLLEIETDDLKKITLYGTSHHSRRITRPKSPGAGLRIIISANSRVQVTLIDSVAQPPRMWIIR